MNSFIHCSFLQDSPISHGTLKLDLALAADLGVAGVLVIDALHPHHVVKELDQLGFLDAHADLVTRSSLEKGPQVFLY